ncbi:metalloendopeptidase OMA1, mitochondrial isoform X2 [Electrophorus electricus]|uniref:metalloendopeptidase OMA1, mitochondrial isoform X2 n=1 Tax=Electrophorus electricus TaxID=8005 RepID=UPI0015CFFF16|nr:metalloendopeptidase OMA1, mitochondrial isoform X2 [Electrophorus electricus]
MAMICIRPLKSQINSFLVVSRLRTAHAPPLLRWQQGRCLKCFSYPFRCAWASVRLQLFETHAACDLKWSSLFDSSRLTLCQEAGPRLLYPGTVHGLQLGRCFPAIKVPVKTFHTSGRHRAVPAPLVWLVFKPLQKVAAIILGRSIRLWWKSLPANKKQVFREWAWQRRWALTGAWSGLLLVTVLFFLTHLEETPLTGRTRLLVFSREKFMDLSQFASDECMEQHKDSFVPASDPRHQVVERLVQHLVQRNHDIEGIDSVPWTVHVVDSPALNAFVLPNGKVFVFAGMLEAVKDVHQLTFVLGHEMAHALIGHAAEQASMSHVVDLLSFILLTVMWTVCPRDSLAVLGHWIQGKLAQFLFDRPYSRSLEVEADQVALRLAAKQMELADQLSGVPVAPEWLSTHPSYRSRISNLDRLMPEALEIRASCKCPALPAADPRVTFSRRRAAATVEGGQETRRRWTRGEDGV